jgi:hypothetical protein
MDTLAEHLDQVRRRLVHTARHVTGARALREQIYRVGPMTALALRSWLGGAERFSSSRKWRSGSPAWTSPCTPPIPSAARAGCPGKDRKCFGGCCSRRPKPSARTCAPGHRYYTDVKQRYDANRAALSQARRIVRQAAHILTALGDDAFTVTTVAHTPSSTVVTRRVFGDVGRAARRRRDEGHQRGQLLPTSCQTAPPPGVPPAPRTAQGH